MLVPMSYGSQLPLPSEYMTAFSGHQGYMHGLICAHIHKQIHTIVKKIMIKVEINESGLLNKTRGEKKIVIIDSNEIRY